MRVVVTRAAGQAGPLAEALSEAGHEPVLCPLIRTESLGDAPIDTTGYDWLVVTSANGARELARRRVGALPRVAAIGPATADALEAGGLAPDLVPAIPTQEGLLDELPRPAGRILLAAAEGARRLLVDELGADFVALYRTEELRPARPPSGDLAVVASPSAARALAAVTADLPVLSIGPHTTREVRRLGLPLAAEASRPDPESIVAAISSLAPSWPPSSPS